MFQTIQGNEIFDASSESDPAYWLAQLRKADGQYLLKFVDVSLSILDQSPLQRRKSLRHLVIPHRHTDRAWTACQHT
jgi:hypothetical protein